MNDAEFEKALKDAVWSAIGDDDDLIRRGDALNAIRESCISEHLPFDSYSPEGQRVLKALNVVRMVKKVGAPEQSDWKNAKAEPPPPNKRVEVYCKPHGVILGFYDAIRDEWRSCDYCYLQNVTHWRQPPPPPEDEP